MSRKPKLNHKKLNNTNDIIAFLMMKQHFIKLLEDRINDKNLTQRLGKLIIWENIISYKLAYLIRLKENILNEKLLKNDKFEPYDPEEILSNLTLGQLINIFKKYFPESRSIHNNLISFNASRNIITHYMHLGYSDIGGIKKQITDLIKDANKIIRKIDINYKKMSFPLKIKVPRVLNIDDLINYEKEIRTAKYPNPYDAKNNLKKFNKNK